MGYQYDDATLHLPECCWTYDEFEADGRYWIKIKGFENYYISDCGEVLSLRDNRNPRIMRTYTNRHGHRYVDLQCGNGTKKKCLVHRMVAEAFGSNPERYPIVRHLDDDPDNNHYSNLRYGTQKDNVDDCARNEHMYVVGVYCYENNTIYKSVRDAAEYFGVDKSAITMCCRGQIHSVRGFHFCYESEMDEKMSDLSWTTKVGNNKGVAAINCESGERIEFSSRKEASEYLGIPGCGISSAISGRIRSTHGWTFEDLEVV